MMHSACSPAATPRDSRGCVQPTYGQAAYAASKRPSRAVDFEGNAEPSLDELMDDDVMRRLMARDGVQPDQVWSLMDSLRNRLR